MPYRDGSYEYYLSEPVVSNDPKGAGAFMMATAEALKRETVLIAQGVPSFTGSRSPV